MAILAACDPSLAPPASPTPAARPDAPVAKPKSLTPSAESRELSRYYARVQSHFLTQGLLRQDGGGPDVPFNARQLAENFVQIALFNEYVRRAGVLVADRTAQRLHRWTRPVRVNLVFGDRVSERIRDRDSKLVPAYLRRLARVTGHSITPSGKNGNFHVLIISEDDRGDLETLLRSLVPNIDSGSLRDFITMDRNTYCLVTAYGDPITATYSDAVAVIRAEHPDRLRTSCLHEEIAQGLGLTNDSPNARPSIFNDDEEFGLLTHHDELLLKMLYDPRLKPGMAEPEARPVATRIAAEYLNGPNNVAALVE